VPFPRFVPFLRAVPLARAEPFPWGGGTAQASGSYRCPSARLALGPAAGSDTATILILWRCRSHNGESAVQLLAGNIH
jgi:hypothetical protein